MNVPKPAVVVPKVDVPKPAVAVTKPSVPKAEVSKSVGVVPPKDPPGTAKTGPTIVSTGKPGMSQSKSTSLDSNRPSQAILEGNISNKGGGGKELVSNGAPLLPTPKSVSSDGVRSTCPSDAINFRRQRHIQDEGYVSDC